MTQITKNVVVRPALENELLVSPKQAMGESYDLFIYCSLSDGTMSVYFQSGLAQNYSCMDDLAGRINCFCRDNVHILVNTLACDYDYIASYIVSNTMKQYELLPRSQSSVYELSEGEILINHYTANNLIGGVDSKQDRFLVPSIKFYDYLVSEKIDKVFIDKFYIDYADRKTIENCLNPEIMPPNEIPTPKSLKGYKLNVESAPIRCHLKKGEVLLRPRGNEDFIEVLSHDAFTRVETRLNLLQTLNDMGVSKVYIEAGNFDSTEQDDLQRFLRPLKKDQGKGHATFGN